MLIVNKKIRRTETLNANQPGIYETILTKDTKNTLIRIRASVCGNATKEKLNFKREWQLSCPKKCARHVSMKSFF